MNISRNHICFKTISCTWNVIVPANHSRLIAHNCFVSSSKRRWRHELHSLLYWRIDETVTINNSETAEVQGEATARREQCGYIVHNLFHFDYYGSLWKEISPKSTNTSQQIYKYIHIADMQTITCEVLWKITDFFKYQPFFFQQWSVGRVSTISVISYHFEWINTIDVESGLQSSSVLCFVHAVYSENSEK